MGKITLQLIPRLGGKIREIRLAPGLLVLIPILILVGYVSVYLSFKGIRLFITDREALKSLSAENRELEREITDMTAKILELKRKIAVIHEREARLRALSGVIDESLRLREKSSKPAAVEPEFNQLSRELSGMTELSNYYDSLMRKLNQETGVIDRIPTLRPVTPDAYVSARFGTKLDPFSNTQKPHPGIDFSFTEGAPVLATAAGVVESAQKEKAYGFVVRIRHGTLYQTMYAHLGAMQVRTGQKVLKGQPIGLLGNTGRSMGPHLHYEVIKEGRQVDPEDYF